MERALRRVVMPAAVVLVAFGAAACLPPNPGPTGLYLGVQPNITPVVTPKAQPITWGAAPVIDEHYGGTLYEGTEMEQPDPRPPLLPGGLQPLRLWVANPNNGVANRPAILWFHGGGFAAGIDSMWGLANGNAKGYAARGYVSFSVEYRIDTTLVGEPGNPSPPSLCQWVQDNPAPSDPVWIARRDQCKRNILAAQYDALASLRWVRQHAAEYGVDPNRIAIAGFSAGAVIASHAAHQFDDVGTVAYFAGDDISPAKSKPQATFGASGCTYAEDLGAPTTIGPGDAPTSFIASRFDQAVPYSCSALTTTTARSHGLVAELASYCNESTHAASLYAKYQAATDQQWTTFLARELKIYSQMPAATAAPVCTN